MKNMLDSHIFHTTICAGASQIVLMHSRENAKHFSRRASFADAPEWRIRCEKQRLSVPWAQPRTGKRF